MIRAVRGWALSTTPPQCNRRRRRARVILAAAGSGFFCASVAFADNYTWNATSGLQSYELPANWNPSGPPGPTDIPVFSLNQANTITSAADQDHIALEVLQGSLTLQPDAGIDPVERTFSLLIDSFINGGDVTLTGLPGPPARDFRMDLAENLWLGGDPFSAGAASGLTIETGATLSVGMNLKLWTGSTMAITGGRVDVGTFDHSSGGSFSFTGGSLHAGTFLGNLTNSGGTIAPGTSVGVTQITGNLQMDSGAIEIELGGFTPGSDNDQLQVIGAASFGTSSVVIKTLGDFIPLPGDVFEVVTYDSATGDPTIINQTPFPGLTFTTQVTATSLAIRAEALLPGDANLSGRVDVADLVALATNWQMSGNWLDGDFDGNGVIDKADLGLMAMNWHEDVFAPAFSEALESLGLPASSMPEPTWLGLLMIAPLLHRRRRPHVSQQ